jgi:periplasmic divalent cation tolerance protein
MKLIVIYITYPDIATAKKIVGDLIAKKLIACTTFFPAESMFQWQGKVITSKEVVSLIKTKKENWPKIEAEVIKQHPYEIPCIVKWDADGAKKYIDWAKGEMKS